ncbi:hypothetical protein D9M72_313820 [compost metagenome]
MRQALEHRLDAHCRQQAGGHHDVLAADAVGQPAEQQVAGRGHHQRDPDQLVDRFERHVQRLVEEEHRVEVAGAEDGAQARRHHEQQQHRPEVLPVGETLADRRPGGGVGGLHPGKDRRFMQLAADVDRDHQHHQRHDEGNAPAPITEFGLGQEGLEQVDDQQRGQQAQRCRGLQRTGIQPALVHGGVLGHVGNRAADLAAQRQALQQPQQHQQHGGGDADLLIRGQHADADGGNTHQQDGDQEGVLAPDQVAQAAEQQRAHRPYQEARAEGGQAGQEGGSLIALGEEQCAEVHRQRGVDVEVVPLHQGAEGRGKDDLALLGSHAGSGGARLTASQAERHGGGPLV